MFIFKTRHNLYLKEHLLTAKLIVYIYLVYPTFLKSSVNYYIAVFQYAHTGTWLTLVKNLRTEDFFGRKNRVNEIYS